MNKLFDLLTHPRLRDECRQIRAEQRFLSYCDVYLPKILENPTHWLAFCSSIILFIICGIVQTIAQNFCTNDCAQKMMRIEISLLSTIVIIAKAFIFFQYA